MDQPNDNKSLKEIRKELRNNPSDPENEKDTSSTHGYTEQQTNATQPPPVLGEGEGGGRKGYKRTKLGWIPEEWEVINLGDLGHFLKGKGVPKVEIKDKGFPCLTYGELYTKHHDVIREFYSFISENTASESQMIIYGDILFAGSGETIDEIGKSASFIDSFNAYAGGDIIVFRDHGQNPIFMGYLLNCDLSNKQKYKLGQGHSVVHIYSSGLKSLLIPIPPLPEQQKIAQILSTWDRAISKTELLIAKKQERKKGLMQQLLTGKKRFGEFVKSDKMKKTKLGLVPEEWEVKKVTEIFHFLSTNSFSRKQMQYETSENSIYNIHYGDIHATYKKAILDFEIETRIPVLSEGTLPPRSKSFIKDGDVIIADASEDYEGVGEAIELKNINGKKVLAGLHTFALRDKSSLTVEGFRAYIFKNPKVSTAIKVIATGSKVFGISKANLEKFELILPLVKEQKKIASVLSVADQEIVRLQCQLDKLKEQKKGLMQKLLTGEVSVKID